jgi:8-oxo-dGTP pyrophosphatase MutT (NUDIX family)
MEKPTATQYACLPYRQRADGAIEVVLVTSRGTRRWVIPKGWPMKGRKPHASAAREALEEAGLVGQVSKAPIGSYRYAKRLKGGEAVACKVEVFALAVKSQRTIRWFSLEEAADAVQEAELGELIRSASSVIPVAGAA